MPRSAIRRAATAADAHIRATSINNYDTLTVLADNASVIAAGAASGGVGGNGLAGAIVVTEITPIDDGLYQQQCDREHQLSPAPSL